MAISPLLITPVLAPVYLFATWGVIKLLRKTNLAAKATLSPVYAAFLWVFVPQLFLIYGMISDPESLNTRSILLLFILVQAILTAGFLMAKYLWEKAAGSRSMH